MFIFAFFFFNDTATTEIYTLSLHDALPISDYENAVDNTWSLGIGQTFDWAGKRKARGRVATSDRLAIAAQYRAVRWDVTVELLSGLEIGRAHV